MFRFHERVNIYWEILQDIKWNHENILNKVTLNQDEKNRRVDAFTKRTFCLFKDSES